jgi:hypothetical protein
MQFAKKNEAQTRDTFIFGLALQPVPRSLIAFFALFKA